MHNFNSMSRLCLDGFLQDSFRSARLLQWSWLDRPKRAWIPFKSLAVLSTSNWPYGNEIDRGCKQMAFRTSITTRLNIGGRRDNLSPSRRLVRSPSWYSVPTRHLRLEWSWSNLEPSDVIGSCGKRSVWPARPQQQSPSIGPHYMYVD
jgi:hypothetical protein